MRSAAPGKTPLAGTEGRLCGTVDGEPVRLATVREVKLLSAGVPSAAGSTRFPSRLQEMEHQHLQQFYHHHHHHHQHDELSSCHQLDEPALQQHELLMLEEYRQQLDLENHIRQCQCSCNHLGYGNYWSYKVSWASATSAILFIADHLKMRHRPARKLPCVTSGHLS